MWPGIDIGFGWDPGIDLGLYFGGWGDWGWGGWGWSPDLCGGSIILNHFFFHDEPLGSSAWAHDPTHRLGVRYADREVVAGLPGEVGEARTVLIPRGSLDRGFAMGREGLGSSGFEQRSYADTPPLRH